MVISMFLAQVIGLLLLAVSLAMFTQPTRFKKIIADAGAHAGLVYFMGVMSVTMGLLVVLSHNIWSDDWHVLITLFGWFLLLQGLARLFCPDRLSKLAKRLIAGRGFLVMSLVWLVFGAILTWVGFSG